MRMGKKLVVEVPSRFIDEVNKHTGNITSFLIIPIIVIIVYEVVLRYIFGRPTFWAHESSQLLFGSYVVLGGAYCLYHRAHVRVDIIYNQFAPRVRVIADVVIFAVFLLFCSVLLWKAGGMAQLSLSLREHSHTPWSPVIYPFKMVVPLAVAMLLLQGLVNFIRDMGQRKTGGGAE